MRAVCHRDGRSAVISYIRSTGAAQPPQIHTHSIIHHSSNQHFLFSFLGHFFCVISHSLLISISLVLFYLYIYYHPNSITTDIRRYGSHKLHRRSAPCNSHSPCSSLVKAAKKLSIRRQRPIRCNEVWRVDLCLQRRSSRRHPIIKLHRLFCRRQCFNQYMSGKFSPFSHTSTSSLIDTIARRSRKDSPTPGSYIH